MNLASVCIGNDWIGEGHPTYVVAEIGINHNGSVELAKKLIDGAVEAGCNAVKFQKRTPELCVPREQWGILRETPWGVLSYMDYRRKTEFGHAEYDEIARHCEARRSPWFAACWDVESVAFIERFEPPCHKVPSACITDLPLLRRLAATNKPIILSTGMSTFDEIERAVQTLGQRDLLITLFEGAVLDFVIGALIRCIDGGAHWSRLQLVSSWPLALQLAFSGSHTTFTSIGSTAFNTKIATSGAHTKRITPVETSIG